MTNHAGRPIDLEDHPPNIPPSVKEEPFRVGESYVRPLPPAGVAVYSHRLPQDPGELQELAQFEAGFSSSTDASSLGASAGPSTLTPAGTPAGDIPPLPMDEPVAGSSQGTRSSSGVPPLPRNDGPPEEVPAVKSSDSSSGLESSLEGVELRPTPSPVLSGRPQDPVGKHCALSPTEPPGDRPVEISIDYSNLIRPEPTLALPSGSAAPGDSTAPRQPDFSDPCAILSIPSLRLDIPSMLALAASVAFPAAPTVTPVEQDAGGPSILVSPPAPEHEAHSSAFIPIVTDPDPDKIRLDPVVDSTLSTSTRRRTPKDRSSGEMASMSIESIPGAMGLAASLSMELSPSKRGIKFLRSSSCPPILEEPSGEEEEETERPCSQPSAQHSPSSPTHYSVARLHVAATRRAPPQVFPSISPFLAVCPPHPGVLRAAQARAAAEAREAAAAAGESAEDLSLASGALASAEASSSEPGSGSGASQRSSSPEEVTASTAVASSSGEAPPSSTKQFKPPVAYFLPRTNGESHPGAVRVSRDLDGGDLFVGRAFVCGELLPGKVAVGHHCCYVPLEGKEIACASYEILVLENARAEWVKCRNGNRPANAFPTGRTLQGKNIYTARARCKGTLTPGMLLPDAKVCHIPYDMVVSEFEEYEVLTIVPLGTPATPPRVESDSTE